MKKIGLLTLLILATVLMTLAITAAANPKAPAPPAAVAPVPAAAPAAAALPPEEDHPHIHAALESMREAKHHLESAAHDFHGHRVEAIKHLDAAIHEAEICEHEK